MNAFAIGTSALAVGQRALDLIGQNISNATTPGYHRQAVNLTSRIAGNAIGLGVDVASITRYDAPPLRAAILRANGEQGSAAVQLETNRQVEANLGSGTGGVGEGLTNLFNQLVQLTSRPDDLSARRPVVASAADLADRFRSTAGEIDRFRAEFGQSVSTTVSTVNTLTKQIADLNVRVANQVGAGSQPNDLIDQRGQLIDQLSGLVDVRVIDQPSGTVNLLSSGAALVTGEFANQFQANTTPTGNIDVTLAGTTRSASFSAGKLAGQLHEFNVNLPATRARLDGLAQQVIRQFNQVQATGLGNGGPLATATGTVEVADPNAALGLGTGSLTISVTDGAGNRTNTAIPVTPATTQNQLVTALNGVPGVAASIAAGGVLKIDAVGANRFDFAGRDTNPPGGGAVANSDPAGVLSGLGVNGLFTGGDSASITLRPDIAADANLLAASRTGNPGDATNLERFSAIRDQNLFSGRTLTQEFNDLASSVGSQVNSLDDQQTARAAVVANLSGQEQGVTGVDTNEELLNLLSYQRMVEGASKYLSAVNTALDSILNIIR